MRVAIVCVNYNSYDSLKNYLYSIEKATIEAHGQVEVTVYVADNSANKEEYDIAPFQNIAVKKGCFENLGYLGGAFAMLNAMDEVERSGFDFIAISNVDVTMRQDFFVKLIESKIDNTIAWVAPSIFFEQLNKVGSEEWSRRPSSRKMKFYDFLYAHPTVHFLYWIASRLRHHAVNNTESGERLIYSGYGSFMLFTKSFISKQPKWEYKPFLYGEEVFFAEMALRYGMKVLYAPQLRINDIGNVSTKKIGSRKKMKIQRESNRYLYEEFFK